MNHMRTTLAVLFLSAPLAAADPIDWAVMYGRLDAVESKVAALDARLVRIEALLAEIKAVRPVAEAPPVEVQAAPVRVCDGNQCYTLPAGYSYAQPAYTYAAPAYGGSCGSAGYSWRPGAMLRRVFGGCGQ